MYIDLISLNDLQLLNKIKIKCNYYKGFKAAVDENSIYYIDSNATLWSIDKFSGESFYSVKLKSICISNMVFLGGYIYFISILPTRIKKLELDKYFLSKVESESGKVIKLNYKKGNPNKCLAFSEDRLFFGDENSIYCQNTNDQLLWSASFPQKMDNSLFAGKKQVVRSSFSGNVKCFDFDGKNLFNVQITKTDCFPTIINESLFWASENNLFNINIQMVVDHLSGWQTHTKLEEKITCMGEYDNEICIGGINGSIIAKDHKISSINESILSIKQFDKKIICETPDKIHVLGESND